MRILLFTFLSFLFQNILFAQQEINFKKIAQSKPINFDKNEYFLNKPIKTKDGIFYIKGKYRNYMIVRLSDDLKIFRQKKIKLKTKKRKHKFEFIINHNGKLLLFSSFINKSINKRSLVYHEVNPSTLEISDASAPVANISLQLINGTSKKFYFNFSPDRSKIIFYSYRWKNDNETIMFSPYVFDKDLVKMWSLDDYKIEKGDGFKMSIGNLVLDNLGNIHLLKKVSRSQGVFFNKEKAKYDYSIFSFMDNGEIKKNEKINGRENSIIELALKVTRDQHLVAMGFYNNEKNLDGANGIVHIAFDENGSPLDNEIIFSPVVSYDKKNAFSIWDEILPFYNIKNILEKPSGNLVMVAEDSKIIANGPPGQYHHGEMLVVENKKDGNPYWMFEIHKSGFEDVNIIKNQSYLFFYKGEDLFLIYNNHPDNLNGAKKAAKFKSQITVAQIDKNGIASLKALFPNEKSIRQKFTIIPSGRILEDEIIILKIDKLLKLKIE